MDSDQQPESPYDSRRSLAVGRLKGFFRRLERNSMITREAVQTYIGDIITLDSMARGEFDDSKLSPTHVPYDEYRKSE